MGRVRRTVDFDSSKARHDLRICFPAEKIEKIRADLIQILTHEQYPPAFTGPTEGYYEYDFETICIRIAVTFETPPTMTSKMRVASVKKIDANKDHT